PGQGPARAPLSRPEAGAGGGAGRRDGRARPASGEAAGAGGEIRRGGDALQRREEGHREGREEARARARRQPRQGSLLRLRGGAAADRDRLLIRLHPGRLTADVHLLADGGGDRRGEHAQRLSALHAPRLPAPLGWRPRNGPPPALVTPGEPGALLDHRRAPHAHGPVARRKTPPVAPSSPRRRSASPFTLTAPSPSLPM